MAAARSGAGQRSVCLRMCGGSRVSYGRRMRRTTKVLAGSAVCLSALGLTPNAATAEDLQPPIPASFACEYFKPHATDTLWIAGWIHGDGEPAFDVANCAAIH